MGLPTKETDFLADFDLHSLQTIKRTLKKNPMAYCLKPDGGESLDHWNLKYNVYYKIKNKYGDIPKFFITTEQKQEYNPFVITLDDKKEHYKFYRLDICVIYFDSPRHPMIMDIEIDSPYHFMSRKQINKDKLRDRLLSERYNVHVERVDLTDPDFNHFLTYLHNRIDSKHQ